MRHYFLYLPFRIKKRIKLLYLYFKQGGRCKNCFIKMRLPTLLEFLGRSIRCGVDRPDLATFEHVKRKVDGGGNEMSNIVILCWTCNHLKGLVDAGHIASPFAKLVEYNSVWK